MRILFIGDIVGSPGRRIVVERVADLIANERLDLVIANGENAASGFGITPRLAEQLLATGIEVLSGGNHIFDRKEILEFIPHEPRAAATREFPGRQPRERRLLRRRAQRHAVRRAVPAGARIHGAE